MKWPRRWVSSSTCVQTQSAVEDAQRGAEVAIATISDQPEASLGELLRIRDSLRENGQQLREEEAELVARADEAVSRLLRQSRRSGSGKPVNGEVVGAARDQLLEVVKDAREVCAP